MTELITRLEALTGPDKSINADIHHWHLKGIGTGYRQDAPAYTGSLDAAMTLVSEGWTVATITQNDDKSWFVELREGFLTSYNRVAMSPIKTATLPIALCIAALVARKTP